MSIPAEGAGNPLAELLAERIRRDGPIRFSEFMDAALYDPEHGYYTARGRGGADPFGKGGDFFTASQLQPVFGRLIASALDQLAARLGLPRGCTLADWGAGRGELAPFLDQFDYRSVDVLTPPPATPFAGLILANELFDALPADVAGRSGGEIRMQRVAWREGSFVWQAGEPLEGEWLDYAQRLAPAFGGEPEWVVELPVRAAPLLARMSLLVARGAIVILDYGYTARELARFPRGTLMSYRRHRAAEDVLCGPGRQDITAHAPFSYIAECAERLGWRAGQLEDMRPFLLRTGERDQFASALGAPDEASAAGLRLQLKTLLFGMGETFRCLELIKTGSET